MSNKLFVGSLPWQIEDDGLKTVFEKYGEVISAKVIKDRQTNKPRGFGFVEMKETEDAKKAIEALNGSELNGRKITVSEAKPKA